MLCDCGQVPIPLWVLVSLSVKQGKRLDPLFSKNGVGIFGEIQDYFKEYAELGISYFNYVFIFIYILVCVCVCVCVFNTSDLMIS